MHLNIMRQKLETQASKILFIIILVRGVLITISPIVWDSIENNFVWGEYEKLSWCLRSF